MSSSDARMFEALAERVTALEAALAARRALMEPVYAKLRQDIDALMELSAPKEMAGELYGAAPDHAADREARAALLAKRRDRG